jgi:DAACS family dicarboxylate/amino acid:cation (Na+ or H+) symporter
MAALHPRLSLHMIAGLVAGLVLGLIAHVAMGGSPALEAFTRNVTDPIGSIFLRLLFVLVIPIIFSALSLSVAGVRDMRSLGRVGLKMLAYTVVASTIAVLIGMVLVQALRPGAGISTAVKHALLARPGAMVPAAAPAAGTTGVDFFVALFPQNVVKAMAEGDYLGVMVFSLLFGVGLALTRSEAARRLEQAVQGLFEVVMRLLELVLRVAPLAVGCLLFSLVARLGFDVLRQLGAYVLVMLLGLALQQFGVYSLSAAWLGRMSPLHFFRAVREPMLTAFSTASSNASLPISLAAAEEHLKLPRHVSRFVLTLGTTANQNGTALFECVTVLFLAQFYGVTLSFAQLLTVVFICILGGIGTAGVPAGSIPVIVMMLGLVGVPAEGIAMILGLDRFLDMCRTTLNVTGDLAAAVVVARGEAEAVGTVEG